MSSSKCGETRSKIIDVSGRLEEVLLRLLTETEDLRDNLETEIRDREKEIRDVREVLKNETQALKDALNSEKRYLYTNQGNLCTGEGDLPLVHSSIH
jgi:Skp family chaperone for outer membrane proteins